MLDFFDTIIDFFEVIFSLISNMVTTLLTFVQVMVSSYSIPNYLVAYVPSIIASSFLAVVWISVCKLLVGR